MSQANGFAGKIGVLMGGNSSERSISLKSGEAVLAALRQKEYDVIPLDVQGSRLEILNKIKNSGITLAFITLHGKGGEDGFIQTLLEEINLPYIGSNPEGSKKASNKLESKKIFDQNGIPTPRYAMISGKDWQKKIEGLAFPLFIKPVDEGSSIGVKKIKNMDEMLTVAPKELDEYDSLLVEEGITGRELTVGILGGKALPVIELKPKREFYDYTAKYTKGMTEYLVPAPIAPETAARVQQMALEAFRVLGLRDFSRVDFMLNQKEEPFVLEVNTIPGFTETSLLPKAAKEAGIEFADVCSTLIYLAKERNYAHGKKK